jgi:hypothetical protein
MSFEWDRLYSKLITDNSERKGCATASRSQGYQGRGPCLVLTGVVVMGSVDDVFEIPILTARGFLQLVV